MLRLLVAIALVACRAHHDPAPPPPKVPVLPDSITNQLGNVGLALAIDLKGLETANLASLAPADPPCMRRILESARLGALSQSGARCKLGHASAGRCGVDAGDVALPVRAALCQRAEPGRLEAPAHARWIGRRER